MIKDKKDLVAVLQILTSYIKPKQFEAIVEAQKEADYCWLQCGTNAQIEAQEKQRVVVEKAIDSLGEYYTTEVIKHINNK